jgi:hypothetical protein
VQPVRLRIPRERKFLDCQRITLFRRVETHHKLTGRIHVGGEARCPQSTSLVGFDAGLEGLPLGSDGFAMVTGAGGNMVRSRIVEERSPNRRFASATVAIGLPDSPMRKARADGESGHEFSKVLIAPGLDRLDPLVPRPNYPRAAAGGPAASGSANEGLP